MKPLSAFYYIKHNKKRAILVMAMMFFTAILYLAGAFTNIDYFYDKSIEIGDHMLVCGGLVTDEDFKDYFAVLEDMKKDPELTVLTSSNYGHASFMIHIPIGFETGAGSYVFETPEDMKTAFDILGLRVDLTDVKQQSIVISQAYADNIGVKKGDVLDKKFNHNLDDAYTVDAIIEENSFDVFYVDAYGEGAVRCNVLSKTLSGQELYDHVSKIANGRKFSIQKSMRDEIEDGFGPFRLIFYVSVVIISIILAVVVNAVITEFYLKRRYEFGVYRAIGLSRKKVFGKVAREIILMDFLGLVIGMAVVLLTIFLLNELVFIPKGQYLTYYSNMSLMALLVSNLLVLVPTVLIKGRGMAKVDITEF